MDNSEEVIFEYKGYEEVPVNVTKVLCHQSITKIKACSFENCTKLREIVLTDGIVQIGKQAFSGCSSLESITLPSTMIKIYSHAFCKCTRLQNVTLNNGLKEIKTFAFYGCTSLQRITIPSTVTDISNYAFHRCVNLREVELKNDGLQIRNMGKSVFDGCSLIERLPFPSISTRLRNIISTDQVEVKSKIDELISVGIELMLEGDYDPPPRLSLRPIARENSELFLPSGNCNEWDWIIQCLDKIIRLIRYYEIKEETTLFELAWKAKMDYIEVPGPVKDTILQYLL